MLMIEEHRYIFIMRSHGGHRRRSNTNMDWWKICLSTWQLWISTSSFRFLTLNLSQLVLEDSAFQIKLAICNYVLVNNGQVCISQIDQIILFTHFKFHFWSFWPHAFESLTMEIRIFKSTPNWAHYFHFNSYASAEPTQEPYFSMIVSKRSACCSSSLHKLHKVRFGCHDPSFVPPIGGGFLKSKISERNPTGRLSSGRRAGFLHL